MQADFSSDIVRAHSWRAFPVGPFPLSDETTAPNGIRVADRYDVATVQHCFRHVPNRLMPLVRSRYETAWKEKSRREANLWAWTVAETLQQGRAGLAESEDTLRRVAQERANEVRRMLGRAVLASSTVVYLQLTDILSAWSIPIPDPKKTKLTALCARMSDASWWRRKLRAHVGRSLEAFARDIGAVHRKAGLYVSEDAAYRYGQRQRRAARYIDETELMNLETGELFPLADAIAASVSNPVNRRNELMTRMRGFEKWAEAKGHVGRFYTITCPSKFHARHKDGEQNKKWDASRVGAGHVHLCEMWKLFRSWASRNGIHPYGFRVSEPHHDGTPHWHLLLFMRADDAERVTERLRGLALSVDGDERGARENRFDSVAMSASKGSATGYLAKYIAKNIDGFGVGEDFEAEATPALETAARVKAWASTHGIRQFQQIGGPGVGVWREMRRLRAVPAGQWFALTWAAVDDGDWCAFVQVMGGTDCTRADRPVSVWSLAPPGRLNRYHEPAPVRAHGLKCGKRRIVTRPHEWALRPCRGVPRTRGNNCTATVMRGDRVPREKIDHGPPESAW